ncbi:recombinase family protein [Salinimicrobium sp. GXAS 041]|uniref:recombinase family protein n=1 Tax=Salinimicrobium sp. GXAS 041 TaxID=3400806 RepID=UPI003C734FE8
MLAIYTRLSKEDEESTSIDNQLREGKEFAHQQNYKDYKIYNEGEGVSGTVDISQRPVFSELVNDILQGDFKAVWFRNQNRLERNSLTFHIFLDACKKSNTKIFHADQEFNYNDPNQLLTSSILSNLNAYSAQLQSVQTKKVLKSRIEQGLAHGMLAYGYGKDADGFLMIDNDEAETVKLIYSLSLKGQGYDSIAKHLNSKGIKTRYAQLGNGEYRHKDKYTGEKTVYKKANSVWSGKSVSAIIKNPIYKGERIWKGESYKAPAILTPEYWNQVNDNLTNNRNNSGKKVNHKYLLKGIMRCGRCGRNYYGRSRVNKKDHYYQCSSKRTQSCGNRSINIDKIEAYVWVTLFLNGEIENQITQAYQQDKNVDRLNIYENELSLLNRQIKSYENKIDKALELIIEGTTTKKLLQQKIKSYENSIKTIDQEIGVVKGNIEKVKNSKQIIKDYESEFSKLTKLTTFPEKKEIVNKYIREITITSDENNWVNIGIEFNIDIPTIGGLIIPEMGNDITPVNGYTEDYTEKLDVINSHNNIGNSVMRTPKRSLRHQSHIFL